MADFAELRDAVAQARAQAARTESELAGVRDRIVRLRAQRAALDRVRDPADLKAAATHVKLDAEIDDAEQGLASLQAAAARAAKGAAAALGALADAADPQQAIGELDDALPILLLPVRLETRFGESAEGTRQLWVRIFPDECSIDTFEPELTDDEVEAARRYWIGIWAAGGVEAQERTAWRALVASVGSGRARFILDRVAPADPDARPDKALPTDVVLVLDLEVLLDEHERDAVAAFWTAMWRAGTDAAAIGQARAALVDEVGEARAAEIEADVVPANLANPPPAGMDRADVGVTVAELVLSAAAAGATASWTRAPTAALLPDRFVFLGYPFDGVPVVAVGKPIPSPLVAGPDPADPPHQDPDGELVVPDTLAWTVDFDRAVRDGMGMRVDLDGPALFGFRRVLVVGLRSSADPETAGRELEELLRHHAQSRGGLAVLPQGTPTNNTEGASSGLLAGDDPDASFDGATFPDAAGELDRRDGEWLAEHLGIDPDAVRDVPGADGLDQADARAMTVALWPATLGYWMDTLMAPVFDPATAESTRLFATRFVSGRGAVPPLRIGSQPYGILPVTAFSRMTWLDKVRSVAGISGPYLRVLYGLLRAVLPDWRAMTARVRSVAEPGDDPHAALLDVLGLHPGSVEYAQRWTERFGHVRRRLELEGLDGGVLDPRVASETTRQLLARLGWTGATPELGQLLFFGRHNRLTGPVIDEAPLSERTRLPDVTGDGRSYLAWLVGAASTSLDALYRQEGFSAGTPPRALLYLLARHALQLGYHETGVRLHEAAGIEVARAEPEFLHLAAGEPSASRYAPLYARVPEITGSDAVEVGQFIGETVETLPEADHLRDQLRALEHLDGASTARLERAFAEHVDLCSYRLDAWLLGLVHLQLRAMRGTDGPPRRGVHLGAYAWLEDLRPDEAGEESQGYVHAPSLNQAVTAAVLRSAHAAHGGDALAVDLTSSRVRDAMDLLEGMRQGQSLGALLGYRLERGLHDAHAVAEVDAFILDLRRAFPLAGDRLASTSTEAAGDPAPIEAIEARNVMDGLRLVEQVVQSGSPSYPFGRTDLPPATDAQRSAIDAEVARLVDLRDAVGDLALAEGVHQAMLGNPDRVASTLDAFSKGSFPPEPQVVSTPGGATGITHRVALHLDAGATAMPSATPRARCEPALDAWLASMLPPLGDVACTVAFLDADTGSPDEIQVTLGELGLRPIDLLGVLRDDAEQGTGELDDRVVLALQADRNPRPDAPIAIRHMDAGPHPVSVFEVLPLARSLRALLAAARPLRPTDLRLSAESDAAHDEATAADRGRVAGVRDDLASLRDDAEALRVDLEDAAEGVAPEALLAGMDVAVDAVCDLLPRAAAFGAPQAGWTFALDARRDAFAALLRLCGQIVEAWTPRAERAQGLVDDEAAGGLSSEERIDLLLRAEALVSTQPVAPLPPLGSLRALVAAKVQAFGARRDAFAAIGDTTETTVSGLLAQVQALLPVAALDPQEPELDVGIALRFVQDAARIVAAVIAEIDARLAASQTALDEHDATASAAARLDALTRAAKALLGEDFLLLGRFTLPVEQAAELTNAHAAGGDGTLLADLELKEIDEPVDTWLYGMARVREPLRAWEQAVMLAGALGAPEPELHPHQLPYMPDDRWLALDLPPDPNLRTARLLYTAHFAAPFSGAGPHCGLLLDELSETIPTDTVTTGLAFHHDRPSSEAPQAMLLVTPTEFRGAWVWDDLVDALHETLDLARIRAVEPVHVDASDYAPLLPATVMAVTTRQLSISANLAFNSGVAAEG
jgi:hypothetical protein